MTAETKVIPVATTDRQERRRSWARHEILSAALDLFERNGYDSTTVDDIAAAAGISPRTFFRYYESKLQLLLAHEHESTGFDGLLEARPPSERPLDAVAHAVRQALVELVTNDELAVRQLKVALTTPSLRAALIEQFHDNQTELTPAFAVRLGTSENDLNARVMASAVAGAIWTALEDWIGEGAAVDRLGTTLDKTFAALQSGLA